jgi:hypothetical protein
LVKATLEKLIDRSLNDLIIRHEARTRDSCSIRLKKLKRKNLIDLKLTTSLTETSTISRQKVSLAVQSLNRKPRKSNTKFR